MSATYSSAPQPALMPFDYDAVRVERLQNDAQNVITPASNDPVAESLSFDWLRERLLELDDPALGSYFVIDGEVPVPSLCAPESSFPALVNAVITVANRFDLKIVYMIEGERTRTTNTEQLSQAIAGRASTRVYLRSNSARLTLYLERWQMVDQMLQAPRTNPITMKVYLESKHSQQLLETPGRSLRELYPMPLVDECTFDVDVVYTWVNSNDPNWQEMLSQHMGAGAAQNSSTSSDGSILDDRFFGRDELRYSLRSLLTYAPWVRRIHIVSNCEPPTWFDQENDRVQWVYHEEILEARHLPTFNSHAIETALHKIPNVAEHFLYFNDDIFLVKPVSKSDFFVPNGLAKTRPDIFGSVQGEVDAADPDYVNAARNGQRLLLSRFGKTATRLHTHSPQSIRIAVARACEAAFPEAYEETRNSKFRAMTDVSPTSFLYPNFAYLSGEAVFDFPKTSLIDVNGPYETLFDSYLESMLSDKHGRLPLTVCINDGGGSAHNDTWGHAITSFMTTAFDRPCEAEKAN